MIPILFEYNTTDFSTHGIGDLVDAIACESVMNDDGEWELSFSYPRTGELFNELTIGRLVYAKANHWQNNQIFRIYGYEKEIGGKVTINCEHISYELSNIPVKKFKSDKTVTANTVLANMKSNAVNITGLAVSKYTFYSNVSGTAQTQDGYFENDAPSNIRSVLLDGDNSIKGCFGGDLVLDNYSVQLLSTGGADRGVSIDYGVDLMDLTQEENISEMTTGVLPYFRWTAETAAGSTEVDSEQITYGAVQYASGTFRRHKVAPLDLTEYFPNQAEHTSPSASQLEAKAREWISKEDGFGEPEINLTLSYAALGQDVRLHDAVAVHFVKMGIDVKAKVTSYKYDVLKERPVEIQVGKTKKSVLFSLEDASRLRKGLLPPARIKNKSLTSDKYAPNSVDSNALGTGSVQTPKIAESSVTALKIKDGAVVETKIAAEAVTNTKLGYSAVTVNKIADGAVVSDKIAVDAVTAEKILNGAVTNVKVQDQAISLSKMWGDFQVFYNDIIAALAIFSDYIRVNGALECSVLYVRSGYIVMGARGAGEMYMPGAVRDHLYSISGGYSLSASWGTAFVYEQYGRNVYDFLMYSLNGSVSLNNYSTASQTALIKTSSSY